MKTALPQVVVQVIIPARNEEDCIGRCLESLVSQQGISFRITLVDDGSTDATRAIAESFASRGVTVISPSEPSPGVSGKCNALIAGTLQSSTQSPTPEWFLFTDADTYHYPGSLAAAVREAEDRHVDLLSYSPEQETESLAEQALMPVVFAELVRTYPPQRVNDPNDPAVAANGQYILARRASYEAVGGHQAVAHKILEDVELARLFKVKDYRIWFRQGAGQVRTRMYRSLRSLWEGWTKNLALLFAHPLRLAAWRATEFLAIAVLVFAAVAHWHSGVRLSASLLLLAAILYAIFLFRIARAHFSWSANLLAFFGLPIFVLLLVNSYIHIGVRGAVTWKGRQYPGGAASHKAGPQDASGLADAKEQTRDNRN